ncbi:hypothetical protein COCON_G00182580 [Conger conger]|uniref:CBM21 domain-containing protein n=1 Tax=Conger conger TaxID=82655 RepID=A0A9Q1D5U0_CONCO|nr:hypothetical protein COCON_G00182580 [Conger conger]
MSNGNNYLNIPSKEAALSTRSAEETGNSAAEDEDEEESEECYTLVLRSSPVPRRRGLSLFDETVEYMKLRLTLPSRRVSFVDSHGGDLVEVKEFVAFDSDEEEDPRWEIEDARYRPAPHEPIYQVFPEFEVPANTALMLAVQNNKIEMEGLSFIENDPLSFSGLIRVLNICFNKAVYVRFTMDGWKTFFDYPADYVQGSNDVETDQYSFKLSFAAPFTTHGSKIEFVLRYETPEGDFWSNNGGKNYVMVLHVSYADNNIQANGMNDRKLKSILKPARIENDSEEASPAETAEEDSKRTETENTAPKRAPILPQIVQPKIDIENEDARPSSPSKNDTDRIVDSVPPPSDTPLSLSAVDQVEVFAPITTQPLTTQPQSESPQKVDFSKHNWVLEEHVDDSVPGAQTYSYTKTQTVLCTGGKTTVKVSSESNIFNYTTSPEAIPLPKDEDGPETDQDVVEAETASETSDEINKPPVSIPSPYKDADPDHKLEMEPNDQRRGDSKGYLRHAGAFESYQSLASERQVAAYLDPPEKASKTVPDGELSAPRAAAMVSQPGEEELTGLDSSEEDQPTESPAEPATVPSQSPVLHFIPDDLATEFDELLVPSGYDLDAKESLLEFPVASAEEVSHALRDTSGEITPPDRTAFSTHITADAAVRSLSHTYSHALDEGVWEEQAEEYSCPAVLPAPLGLEGDSPLEGVESHEQREVVRQRATEPATAQSAQLAAHLRQAYVTSSVFLKLAFCLVLAYHHLDILPFVLLYFICL